MANKPRNEKSMVPINLHVEAQMDKEAARIAKVRKVSKSQVIREWIEIGKTKTTEPYNYGH
jgi:hypothetical protein